VTRERFIVAVSAVIFRQGKVLAVRRSPLKIGAGLWETPSGRVQKSERVLDAVMREVREETGLNIRLDSRPIDAYAAKRGSSPMVVILYRAEWVLGEVQLSSEHDRFAWWTPAQFARESTLPRLSEAVALAAQLAPSSVP
jgi:8-oxo-dGTP pyrophosphatase MutT (NUDIX family)